MLDTWNDGPAKSAIVDFVDRVVAAVEPDSRVAVFDNDGTLWCEKPMYIQLDFLIRRFVQQAAKGDLKWFGEAVTKHYQGDDSDVEPLVGAILTAHHAIDVEEHRGRVETFFAHAEHPTLGRPYTACGYRPMVELLRYLEANGFTNYIVSGGGRDFMRPITGMLYGFRPSAWSAARRVWITGTATCTPPPSRSSSTTDR
jgi:phosphoserine phosphatase